MTYSACWSEQFEDNPHSLDSISEKKWIMTKYFELQFLLIRSFISDSTSF